MNINRVVLTGNLTRDPETRTTPGGLSICKLGIAVNTRRKNGATGDWEEKANFFRVTVFGRQAESCGQYLKKGRPVGIDGRLEWSEYEVEGQKRQSVESSLRTCSSSAAATTLATGTGTASPAAFVLRATSRPTPAISTRPPWARGCPTTTSRSRNSIEADKATEQVIQIGKAA